MSDLHLKFVLEALDKGASSTVRSFTARLHGLGKEVKDAPRSWMQTKAAIDKTASSAEHFSRAGNSTVKELADMAEAQRRFRREAAETETAWGRLIRVLGRKPDQTIRGGGSGSWLSILANTGLAARVGTAVGGLAVAGGAAAVGGAGLFGKSVIDTGAKFEKFQTQLTTSFKSQEKAKEAMSWVQKFAQTTPYELDQVMQAFVQLRAYGIDPTDGTLRSLGDAASGMGKDLMSAVEMIADAQTGEYERLKEFGVKASQQGNKVTFTYTQAGKAMSVTTKKTAVDVNRTLLDIFDKSFAGGMAAQSRTWEGMVSNLADTWTGFKRKIADGGAFEAAKGHLASLLNFLDKAQKDGRLDKWADQISKSLVDLINTMARLGKEVDWVGLAKSLGTVAHAFELVAIGVGKVADAYDKLNSALGPLGWVDTPQGPKPGNPLDLFKPGLPRPPRKANWFDHLMTYTDTPQWQQAPAVRTAPPRPTVKDWRFGTSLTPPPAGAAAPARLKGDITIGLAPGLVLQSATSPGADVTWRRGLAGDRP